MSDDPRVAELERVADDRPDAVSPVELVRLLGSSSARDRERLIEIALAVTDHDWETVNRLLESLYPLLEADSDRTRNAAVRLVAALAAEHPERVVSAVEKLQPRLGDPYGHVRVNAARALAEIARADPKTVAQTVPALEPLLESPVPSDSAPAVAILRLVTEEVPETIAPLTDVVLDSLNDRLVSDDDPFGAFDENCLRRAKPDIEDVWEMFESETIVQVRTREVLMRSFVLAVRAVPDAFADTSAPYRLVSVVGESDPRGWVHESALDALRSVAAVAPGEIDPIEPLTIAFETSGDVSDSRAKAVRVLGLLAEDRPEAVAAAADHVDAMAALLDPEDAEVAGTTAVLLSYVAERDPERVRPSRKRLRDCLDADRPLLRASVAMALGHVGGDVDRRRLTAVAESDPDPTVRQSAADAVVRLEQRTE